MLKGTLFTPFLLSESEKQAIESRFSEITGESVELTISQDASLLGGVMVELNGRIYDGSLKGRLHDVLSLLKGEKEADAHA